MPHAKALGARREQGRKKFKRWKVSGASALLAGRRSGAFQREDERAGAARGAPGWWAVKQPLAVAMVNNQGCKQYINPGRHSAGITVFFPTISYQPLNK